MDEKMNTVPAQAEKDYKYDEYAVRCAVDKLMAAEEVKRDPKMMKLVGQEIGKREKELASLKELRGKKAEVGEKAVKDAYGEDDEDGDE